MQRVKLSAIAVDFDGTIARGDVLDPAVPAVLAAARAKGLTILLVTGRTLDDLRQVAGHLPFIDAVIAENGAMIHFPGSGHASPLGPAVPEAFVNELPRRGVTFNAGHSLVDCDAAEAPQLLETIRTLELPLVLHFNRGRVMVLPQGVTKGTGLRAALETLRISPRNTVAIGDAENDHELLRLAEVGLAVARGSPALCSAADAILPGGGPADVAAYLQGLAEAGRLPPVERARRRLRLGRDEEGREFSLAVRGRNVLVAGDAKSGKSWVAGLLCEELILHGYCVCVVDPEGDYRSLEALPGVTVLGGEDPPPTPREIQRVLRYPDRSLVIDLSHRAQDEKIEYVRAVLPVLNEIRHRTGFPHRILVDEAHYFLHEGDAQHLLDLEPDGYIVVTYRASRLPQRFVAATEVMIVTRESSPEELDALRAWCSAAGPVEGSGWTRLAQLRPGQAAALPVTQEAGGDIRLFTVAPRLTPHVRHRAKYVDVPVTEQRAFVFAADGRRPERCARTLRQFVSLLESAPPAVVEGHLRRGDFSRWIGDVFGDHPLAATLAGIEQRHPAGPPGEAVRDVVTAIRARYELADDGDGRGTTAPR